MSIYGPLTPLRGEWEGNVGVDVSFDHDDRAVGETTYFEKAFFKPIPQATNGVQNLNGFEYRMTAWRHGEENGDPFHDEVGFLLWDAEAGTVMRTFAVPRGIAILQGCDAAADATVLELKADPTSNTFGLVQNPHLLAKGTCGLFTTTFTIEGPDTFRYESDLTLTVEAMGETMQHTDRNTLTRVS